MITQLHLTRSSTYPKNRIYTVSIEFDADTGLWIVTLNGVTIGAIDCFLDVESGHYEITFHGDYESENAVSFAELYNEGESY